MYSNGAHFFYKGKITFPAKNGKEAYQKLRDNVKNFIVSHMRQGMSRQQLIDVNIEKLERLIPEIKRQEVVMEVIRVSTGAENAKKYYMEYIVQSMCDFGSCVILVAELRGLPPSEKFGIICVSECDNGMTVMEKIY